MQSVYLQRIMKKNADRGYEKTKPKQTQSNPTCSELACGELACTELGRSVEPVEGVEPISKGAPMLISGQKRVKMREME